MENKIKSFLKDMKSSFWNSNSNMLIDKKSINEEERKLYEETGYKNMYFEDYYTIGDGIEELLEDKDEQLLEFINENY